MSREDRKLDHIKFALTATVNDSSDFDDLHVVHRSLPGSAFKDCRMDTQIGGLDLSSPIFINAMTGGSPLTHRINHDLAEVARETGVAMAVGSQKAALTNEKLIDTYKVVRSVNPNGIIIANLGGGATPEEAEKAIDMIQADMLQLHLNVPQELVMPEGDRDFTRILKNLEQVVRVSPVPVIVKEVGFGMAMETYKALQGIGVTIIDIGGRGGTNFIDIENRRREKQEYSFLTQWGQSTVVSLLELHKLRHNFDVIASGGIRNSLDVVKSMILGAKAVGVAGIVLRKLSEQGAEEVISMVRKWNEEIQTIMTMIGVSRISELTSVPIVVAGSSKDWCDARGINIQSFANR